MFQRPRAGVASLTQQAVAWLRPVAGAVLLLMGGSIAATTANAASATEAVATERAGDPAAQPGRALPRLSTVQVTAKGYAASALDTPAAVQVIERDRLDAAGMSLGDALRGEPGLAVASDGAQGANPVLRGLKKEGVVLLVDGMRLNSAQPAGAVASFMSLALAERVELVKGASSVLYGTGALGGAVNVLLPQARFEPGLKLQTALGWESASKGLRGTGVLNLSEGDFALMLGAASQRLDDYKSPEGTVARTGYDAQSLIGQLRWRPDAAQQLRLSLQQHVDEDAWYPGSTRSLPNAALGTSTVHSPEQRRNLVELGYSRRGGRDAPNLDVRLWRQSVQRQIWSYANQLKREIAQTTVSFDTTGVDLKADWLLHPEHLVSAGVNLWRMEASPERYIASPTPLSALLRNDPFADARIRAAGLFVQDDMRFGALGVLAGLRWDRVAGEAASMSNGAVTNGLDRSDSALSGSVGLSWEVTPLLRPYANLARGFRAGEMRERYEASPRGDGYHYLGNPQIEPETSLQLELGVKGADAVWDYSAALHQQRISHYITGQATGATVGGLPVKATVNLGSVVIRGLEAQARRQFGVGQWADVKLSVLRGTNRDLDEPLFQMPADELSLGWGAAVTPAWAVDSRLRLVRRQDRVATVFSRGTEDATAGFATADVGATWRYARDHSLRVAVKNLADKAYHEHLTEGVSGQEIQAPGRSLSLAWRGAF